MYPSSVGLKFLVQQNVTGLNSFDGTEYGRARLTVGPGLGDNRTVWIAARLYGAASNLITVQFVDMGPGYTVGSTYVQQAGSSVLVYLRRSVGAVLATSAEVATALNAFTAYTAPGFALRARAEGDGLGVVSAQAATPLTGGQDSSRQGSQYLWTPAGNGGFFHFEHDVPMWVLGFAAKFTIGSPGPYTVSVSRVRLNDDFTPILAEKIGIFYYTSLAPSTPDVSYTDVKQLLHPNQALLVETSAPLPGFVNFDVTRAGEYPYAS
jgi:hypothetical protein